MADYRDVVHRSAGTARVDMLTNPADRAFIVKVLLSIDAATVPSPVAPETLIFSFTSPSWSSHVRRCEVRGTRIETLAGTRM